MTVTESLVTSAERWTKVKQRPLPLTSKRPCKVEASATLSRLSARCDLVSRVGESTVLRWRSNTSYHFKSLFWDFGLSYHFTNLFSRFGEFLPTRCYIMFSTKTRISFFNSRKTPGQVILFTKTFPDFRIYTKTFLTNYICICNRILTVTKFCRFWPCIPSSGSSVFQMSRCYNHTSDNFSNQDVPCLKM